MELLSLWPAFLGIFIFFFTFKTIKNIFFHPLSHIPGPRLVAVSRLYEWYYDCVLIGQYSFKIQKLHDEYGPIIRIGPNEVHIRDSEYFDTLYSNTARLDKDPWFYGVLDDSAAFNTASEIVHHRKISQVEHYFSKANVQRSENILTDVLASLIDVLDEYAKIGKVVCLKNAFKSYAADIVCAFCFVDGTDYVRGEEFSAGFHRGQEGFARVVPWFRFVPGSSTVAQYTPDWLIAILPNDAREVVGVVKYAKTQVKKVISTKPEDSPKPTLLSNIFNSELLPAERTPFVLEQEAVRYIATGTGSTARCMDNAIFHILSSSSIKDKIVNELRSIKAPADELLRTHQLEQLPYLAAVLQESLRCFPAVLSRFPRINRSSAMQYGKYTIPPNIVIGNE